MGKMWYNLENKIAVVTGGSRGIGLELARELLAQKAKVAICGRKKENLDAAVSALGGGDNLLAVQAHVAKEEDVDNLFSAVMGKFGGVDILINNVGMNLLTGSVADTEPATWQKIIDSNLYGTYLCSRKAAGIMKERKSGKIVSVSSIAGRKAAPGLGIYGVAKAAIEQLTRVLAFELAAYNIQVNAVAPTTVRTDFSKPFWSNEAVLGEIVKSIPLGRIAEPEDVVHPVLFLCSGGASYITGQVVMADGGSTA
ncbi:MAG TPA: SDR family oxidoreductase [Spirochaetes bacterium]|nr:SDR family oxidoreductase [Spirochaetota bacterium]